MVGCEVLVSGHDSQNSKVCMGGVDEASSPRLGPTRTPEGRSRVCGTKEDKRSSFQRKMLDAAACWTTYLICG